MSEQKKLKTLSSRQSLSHRHVLLRLDLNVPLEKKGKVFQVADDSRLRDAVPAIQRLHLAGARTIVVTHLGEPEGKTVAELALHPVIEALRKLLPERITVIEETSWDWDKISKAAKNLESGQVLILQNVRFQPGEEKNDEAFARKLASLADVYVNEAFSVSHRAHASLVGVTKFLPAYAGWRFVEEVEALRQVRDHAKEPFVLVLGGAKVHDKTQLMIALASKATRILVGGVIANTIWDIDGTSIGRSKSDPKPPIKELKRLMKRQRYQRKAGKYPLVLLPSDVVAVGSKGQGVRVVEWSRGDTVKATEMIVDIGPKTIRAFSKELKGAATIVWNGPMGLIEDKRFRHGSATVARLIAERSRGKAFGVVGGGESLEVLDQVGGAKDIDFCSTGGGAMLQFLSGRALPGLEALSGRDF